VKLPTRLTIAGREFVVQVVRSRTKANGGRASWGKQVITLYWHNHTTVYEVLDTLYHECVEMWAHGRSKHYTNGDRVIVLIDHEDLREFCGLFPQLFAAINNANGGAIDTTAAFQYEEPD